MNNEERKRLIERKLIEFNLTQQYSIGIHAGIIAGLFVFIVMAFYNETLKNTGNVLIAFLVGIIVLIILKYIIITRPIKKISKELNNLCKIDKLIK